MHAAAAASAASVACHEGCLKLTSTASHNTNQQCLKSLGFHLVSEWGQPMQALMEATFWHCNLQPEAARIMDRHHLTAATDVMTPVCSVSLEPSCKSNTAMDHHQH